MDLLDQPRDERVRRLAKTEDSPLGKDHAIALSLDSCSRVMTEDPHRLWIFWLLEKPSLYGIVLWRTSAV